MRQTLRLIAFIILATLLVGKSWALLSPAETQELQQMLETAGLEPASLCFEKDWDLSTKYKLDWQLRQLQDPWQALEDLQELRETCRLEGSASVPGLLRDLGGIAFNLDSGAFTSLYPAAKSMFDGQLATQVKKPEQIFPWLESSLDYLERELAPAFANLSPQEKKMLLSFWHWQFIESEDIDRL